MTRVALSFLVSCLVLLAGGLTAWVQVQSFERAARLDRMQEELEWYRRRATALREELERFEFASGLPETPSRSPGGASGDAETQVRASE